jgi:hypothetical protein
VTAARDVPARARPDRAGARGLPAIAPAVLGIAVVAVAFLVYLICNRQFNAGRGDLFYLADAFLHGRTWLEFPLGPYDDVFIGDRTYVPFAPFPAVLLMPLVALVGPEVADSWQPIVNALLAALTVGMAWALAARVGVQSLIDRFLLALLFGFSTAIWWVTTRGGVWHTGHLVASLLTLVVIYELYGGRRASLVGLLGGAAFLTRSPLVLAMPFYALWFAVDRMDAAGAAGTRLRSLADAVPWRAWTVLVMAFLPALAFYLWYNAARFGSPLESGYGLATLPEWLAARRDLGLFSPVHLGMNIHLLLFNMPGQIPAFPFFRPDGHGLSILLTSPGLLLAVRADWRSSRPWLLLGAAVATLVPSLLYYGGGWLQYGYRYALDSIPFVFALCALAAARVGIHPVFRVLILVGFVVNAAGVYWAYNI